MQVTSASTGTTSQPAKSPMAADTGSTMTAADQRYAQYKVIRRNGAVVPFEPAKIGIAMTKAFLAVNGGQGAASARVREQVVKLTDNVVAALMKRKPEGGARLLRERLGLDEPGHCSRSKEHPHDLRLGPRRDDGRHCEHAPKQHVPP